MWRAGLLGLAVLLCAAPAAHGQAVIADGFAGSYSLSNLGSPPGVPFNLGGLTVKDGAPDRLLIGGAANDAEGALYEIGVVRDAAGHITGYSGEATRFADAANNDGGVAYGPGGVLFLARWPQAELGQTKPGSTITDKTIALADHGVSGSPGGLGFVPAGLPGAGSLKLASYSSSQWYDAEVVPDGTGTYDLRNVTAVDGAVLQGPEGFAYVTPGSAGFAAPSVLVAEYDAAQISAFEVGADGDPLVSTRRALVTGLAGAEGATVDPVTGDALFSTWGTDNTIVVVRGFADPTPPPPVPQPSSGSSEQPPPEQELPPPVSGESVNALPARGTVRIRVPGTSTFVELAAGEQIPVGTVVDTTKGQVTLVAAGGQQAAFHAGIFKLAQGSGARPLTTLRLVEKLSCPKRGKAAAAAKKKKRRLWGNGSGRFRTQGSFSSATVRGTRWLVEDRCASTLTKVTAGRVSVRDFVKRKTVTVRAGRQYVARRRTSG